MEWQAQKPSDAERIAILRGRCRDRKSGDGNHGITSRFEALKALADHAALQGSETEPSWPVRMGLRSRERLRGLRFAVDNYELLAGRPNTEASDCELDATAVENARQYLATYQWPGGQTGHCQLDLTPIFRLGIGGLIADIGKRAENAADKAARDAFRSFVFALEGLSEMIANAGAAVGAAVDTAPDWRQGELRAMADSCARVKSSPPRGFRDAIQLLWFVNFGVSYADNAGLVSPGHLDRLLIDYYTADLESGVISRDQALTRVEHLYLLVNNSTADGGAIAVMAGGRDADGRDVTNALSYLSFEALRRVNLVYPTVGLCWHEGSPESLGMLACELIAKGYSTPAFFGDETIQRGLKSYGIPPDRACHYINSTCVEITPVGCSNVWVASPYFSLCQILNQEIAAQAETEAPATDFETFLAAYFRRLAADIAVAVEDLNRCRDGRRRFGGKPLQSVFTNSCIERGLDIDHGGADVNWIECSFVGLANLADSLHVIRAELFESGTLDVAGLKAVLDADFAGHEDVRRRFLQENPKYGNHHPEVDKLVARVAAFLKAECAKHKVWPDDSHFIPGAFCWVMHERLGGECGATPDGRRAGFPFADGGGPAQGRELAGPTSSILSTTSWDHAFLIGGLAYNMKFSSDMFKSPEDTRKLYHLVVTFLRRGGFETQINIINRQALEAARKNPEQYRDLVVRIGGYTDYFTRLSPHMQDEVLLRTEHRQLGVS